MEFQVGYTYRSLNMCRQYHASGTLKLSSSALWSGIKEGFKFLGHQGTDMIHCCEDLALEKADICINICYYKHQSLSIISI